MSRIAIDLRGLPKNRADLAVRYADGLGEQLAKNHELIVFYRYPYQLDMVPGLASSGKPVKVSTNLSWVNNRTLNRLGVELLYSPTPRVNRLGARFRVITTDLTSLTSRSNKRLGLKLKADRVVVGSVSGSKKLVERRLVASQPTTIYPSTSLDVTAANVRSEPSERTIIYSGEWIRDKRIELLAEAFGVLGDFELVVTPKLGEPDLRRIQQLFDEQRARVRFAQLSSTTGLGKLISESFAVFQTEIPDVHGLIPADVMALGIPVLVADEPIMQELVGTTGTFIDPNDPLSLAAKVRDLQRHGAWSRAAELARRKSEQQSWKTTTQKLERLIQQLLN